MENPRIGSLCSGYEGIGLAVQQMLGGELVWVADPDPGASKILAHRYPQVPNLGDITAADWHTVPRVNIMFAGWPCQGISNEGNKLGLEDPRSGLWYVVRDAIQAQLPTLVILENVAALETRGLDRVVADLVQLGYTVRWMFLPASVSGAAHPRRRFVAVAELAGAGDTGLVPFPAVRDGLALLPTPKASDGYHGGPNQRDSAGNYYLPGLTVRLDENWVASHNGRDYGPAIRRWEAVMGRPAPAPTVPNARGQLRESPLFVEWLMGLAEGWVTGVPGLGRVEQLHALGNGVVPQQVRLAVEHLRPVRSLVPALVA